MAWSVVFGLMLWIFLLVSGRGDVCQQFTAKTNVKLQNLFFRYHANLNWITLAPLMRVVHRLSTIFIIKIKLSFKFRFGNNLIMTEWNSLKISVLQKSHEKWTKITSKLFCLILYCFGFGFDTLQQSHKWTYTKRTQMGHNCPCSIFWKLEWVGVQTADRNVPLLLRQVCDLFTWMGIGFKLLPNHWMLHVYLSLARSEGGMGARNAEKEPYLWINLINQHISIALSVRRSRSSCMKNRLHCRLLAIDNHLAVTWLWNDFFKSLIPLSLPVQQVSITFFVLLQRCHSSGVLISKIRI